MGDADRLTISRVVGVGLTLWLVGAADPGTADPGTGAVALGALGLVVATAAVTVLELLTGRLRRQVARRARSLPVALVVAVGWTGATLWLGAGAAAAGGLPTGLPMTGAALGGALVPVLTGLITPLVRRAG